MSTILILDDSATNRSIYSRLAATMDHAIVESFGDPFEALSWLECHTADLVVTDFKMPGMNGAEFVRLLRSGQASTADIPVIVVTAYADREFRILALEAGATDFLLSPVDYLEFTTRARNLLRLREQQQALRRRATSLERELENSERSRERLLRDSHEALAQVIDTVPAMTSATDRDGRCVFVNALHARIMGAAGPADLAGCDVGILLGPERAARNRALDRFVFRNGEAVPACEEDVTASDGSRRVLLTAKTPLRDAQGVVTSVLTTALDITDRKLAERRLRHVAHHDALTGLPNRVLLRERLDQELLRGRTNDRSFALHFLDLDRFKAANDALGHHGGDRLLRAVARRLAALARAGDTVARLGGDEFAVVQAGCDGLQDAATLAAQLTQEIAKPFFLDNQEVAIGVSVGVALYPDHAHDAEAMLRKADQAMYQAKATGGSAWRFFTRTFEPHAREAMRTEADLRAGIARGEFVLHYQPQVDLRTGRIVGAEALLRWCRPGHGLLSPASFLALAEESGLILPISEWVLAEACSQAVAWTRAGLLLPRVAVNLSPVQFRRQDVRAVVARALDRSGLEPRMLDLELTEGTLMENKTEVAAVLRDIRASGVGVSLDDFGTGYSSLSYLKNFPLDRLKVDRSFVLGLAVDKSDMAIVRTIVDLAHTLGLGVIAEGIETDEQVACLRAEGCDGAQGDRFSPPLPAETFAMLLGEQGLLPRAADGRTTAA